ncbi:hypothetical protein Moror_9894 [Moniliophthora roreri MCA 2997]|uniref:Uncharacterized protein n=1 Tax=Moniliophthora roreri (strain MCA 2997) TaxID=1381753 RepID=V2WYW1_MONRO|nr:hypothetical protein Moror_9894 [Moniliophthora roreri MCA 2997]
MRQKGHSGVFGCCWLWLETGVGGEGGGGVDIDVKTTARDFGDIVIVISDPGNPQKLKLVVPEPLVVAVVVDFGGKQVMWRLSKGNGGDG